MPTRQQTVDRLQAALSLVGDAVIKKMFGEYGVYVDGVFIGIVSNDRFHLKPTPESQALAGELKMAPAYKGAKPSYVVPLEGMTNQTWFVDLIRTTMSALAKKKSK